MWLELRALGYTGSYGRLPAERDKAKLGFTLYLSAGLLKLLAARREAWVKTLQRAGLPGVRIHDLRHSLASFMLESGADIVDVQKQLAHTKISTTVIYLHLRENRKRERVNAAEQASGIFM